MCIYVHLHTDMTSGHTCFCMSVIFYVHMDAICTSMPKNTHIYNLTYLHIGIDTYCTFVHECNACERTYRSDSRLRCVRRRHAALQSRAVGPSVARGRQGPRSGHGRGAQSGCGRPPRAAVQERASARRPLALGVPRFRPFRE